MDNNKTSFNNEFSDALRVEGVNFKGFGIITKYVMLDPDLTLEAKTIYAYFCSFAGSGNTAFPSRDTIIRNLSINKDTYYKHFAPLVNQGYISVARDLSTGKNGRNIYTLVSNPKKFSDIKNDLNDSQVFNKIRINGLKSFGYGIIPKSIMVDDRLSFKAKGIYAYFCSLTGSGNSAFPRMQKILNQLQIAENTYYKFFNELLDLNYITVVQRNINGKFNINDYYINDTPNFNKTINNITNAVNQTSTPSLKISDIEETPQNQGVVPSLNFSDIKTPSLKISDIKIPDLKIPDSNNNNTIINNIKINQSINQQPAAVPPEKEMDGWMDEHIKKIVKDEIWKDRSLPFHYSLDENKMAVAIKIMTDYEDLRNGYSNEFKRAAFELFNTALIEMCCTQMPMKIKDNFVTSEMVIQKLNKSIVFDEGEYGSPAFISIYSLHEEVLSDYENAVDKYKIHNHLQYMKSCIWNVLQIGSIGALADAKRNGYV